MRTGLCNWQQLGKEMKEGNIEGNAQETIRDRKRGDYHQWTSKGESSRGKLRGDGEGDFNGHGPKGTSLSRSHMNWSALIFRSGCARRNPHAIVGTRWMQVRDTCGLKHTGRAGEEQKGKETIVMKSDETKQFNCVLRGGPTTTFLVRSILREIGEPQQISNSETDIVAMEKDTSVLEKERDHRKAVHSK